MTRGDGERGDVEAALLRRVEEAVEHAREVVEESMVLAGSAECRVLSARCAWCGRYRVDDKWVVAPHRSVPLTAKDSTHGICDDCIADLRARGLSV